MKKAMGPLRQATGSPRPDAGLGIGKLRGAGDPLENTEVSVGVKVSLN